MIQQSLGDVYALSHDNQTVEVREVGAALHSYRTGKRVIVPPPPNSSELRDVYKGGRGQVLIPWPNRVRDGKYEWGNTSFQLPINEAARNNASHGFIRTAQFAVTARSANAITLEARQFAMLGFPFPYAVVMTYELGDDGLTVTMHATNTGSVAMPFGMGMHPYFSTGDTNIDECVLAFGATHTVAVDDQAIPTGELVPVNDTELDFRSGAALGGKVIDVCYTGLGRGSDGRHVARLQGPAGATEIWADQTFDYLMIFTGDTLPAGEQRQAVAIEPMTCAADAFNNHLGLRTLQPGEQLHSTWGVRAF